MERSERITDEGATGPAQAPVATELSGGVAPDTAVQSGSKGAPSPPAKAPASGTTGADQGTVTATRDGESVDESQAGSEETGGVYHAWGVGVAPVLAGASQLEPTSPGSGKVRVQHDRSLSIGARVGGLAGSDQGNSFQDLGLGLAVRAKPGGPVGLQMSGVHYDQTFGPRSDRRHTLLSQSAGLFPGRIGSLQPYALLGVSELIRFVDRDGSGMQSSGKVGPQAGVGVDVALTRSIGLDFELDYVHYLWESAAGGPRGIVQTHLGLLIYL